VPWLLKAGSREGFFLKNWVLDGKAGGEESRVKRLLDRGRNLEQNRRLNGKESPESSD